MQKIFKFNLKKIPNFKENEIKDREKNLNYFLNKGFPNKKDENWKFTDLNSIIAKNFNTITNNQNFKLDKKIEQIKDFDHNKIILVNGSLKSSDISFEEKDKIKINVLNSIDDLNIQLNDNLFYLNKALSTGGLNIEIEENYKCKRPIVIYNYFTSGLDGNIINNSNKVKLNQNSELTLIEYNICENSKFIKNTFEKVDIAKSSVFKNILIQKTKSNGYFYKNIFGFQEYNSSYQNFAITSGLKFNKIEFNINLNKENSNCFILSGLNLSNKEHQEIKSRINHNAPNCKSYQKIKNVLESNSTGVFQGKIYVKNIAQKTDAYQLSNALILNDSAEFNAKPELEIYADDVKCSHGSSSGSIDEDSIHYLMTRGIKLSDAKKLLINGFLSEIFANIPDQQIKAFLEKNIKDQIDGI